MCTIQMLNSMSCHGAQMMSFPITSLLPCSSPFRASFWEGQCGFTCWSYVKDRSPMAVIICSEVQNLVSLIIILTWIATNATDAYKIIQVFIKRKPTHLLNPFRNKSASSLLVVENPNSYLMACIICNRSCFCYFIYCPGIMITISYVWAHLIFSTLLNWWA